MTTSRPKVLIVCNRDIRGEYFTESDLERLAVFADWDWLDSEGGSDFGPSEDADAIKRLQDAVGDVNAIVVCHGSPKIDAVVMDHAPNLRAIGELEGDRFAYRIDIEEAWKRGLQTIDTTNGSSYPVSEWALALMLISLRNAGAYFRQIIEGSFQGRSKDDPGYVNAELTGKRVGLIGCGHIGRRLIEFLKPFDVDIRVYDPYLSKDIPDALGFTKTSLEIIMSDSDVIVCLAPLTPATRGMIGKRELDMIPSGAVFVNVSRGAIVDSDALISRLKRGDIIAGLDVFDPEPVPSDSEIIQLPNVFLSPHIAGVTATSRTRFFSLMVDELDRLFHGHETLFDLTPRSIANRRGLDV